MDRLPALSQLLLVSGVAVAACSLDDVGDLGEDSPPAAEGGQGGVGVGGAGRCSCDDAGSVCSADGECVPRCSSGGGCAGAESEVGQLPDAFGCPGQPATEADVHADWVDESISFENETLVENQHLLIERSSAMSERWNDGTRWSGVLGALMSLPEPQPSTTRTLRFFPADGGTEAACEAASYVDPVAVYDSDGFNSASLLTLGSLLDPAGRNTMVQAIIGSLEGIAAQRTTGADHSDRLVLVVGSYPDLCVSDPEFEVVAELIAAAGALDPPIRTSVIAIGDDVNVDPIAVAANSAPYRIGEDDDGSSLVRALRAGQSCDGTGAFGATSIATPESPERVDVLLEDPGEDDTVERVPEVADAEACEQSEFGGWYFEDPEERTSILLCECSSLRAACATSHVLRGG